jgi:hypothetical protein
LDGINLGKNPELRLHPHLLNGLGHTHTPNGRRTKKTVIRGFFFVKPKDVKEMAG